MPARQRLNQELIICQQLLNTRSAIKCPQGMVQAQLNKFKIEFNLKLILQAQPASAVAVISLQAFVTFRHSAIVQL